MSGTITVEYAKSSRASCRKCKQPIGAGTLRVGPMVQSYMGDFLVPMWHHLRCFTTSKFRATLKEVDQLSGLANLKAEDQIKLREMTESGGGGAGSAVVAKKKPTKKSAGKKRRRRGSSSDSSSSSSSSSSSEDGTAARSKPKTAADAELIRQSDAVWKWRRRINDTLGTGSIRAILDANEQPTTGTRFGGPDALQTRLAEAFVFGVLPKCSVCGGGDLVFSADQAGGCAYLCTGYLDEYALCGASHPVDQITTTAVAKPNTTTATPPSRAPSSARKAKTDESPVTPTPSSTPTPMVREDSKYRITKKDVDAIFGGYTFDPIKRVSLHYIGSKQPTPSSTTAMAESSNEVVVMPQLSTDTSPPAPPSAVVSKATTLLKGIINKTTITGKHQKKPLTGQTAIFAGRQLNDTQKALGIQVKGLGGNTTTDPSEATMCICGGDVIEEAKSAAHKATTKACQIVHKYEVPCLQEGLLAALEGKGATTATSTVQALELFLHANCPSNGPIKAASTAGGEGAYKSAISVGAVPLRSFAATTTTSSTRSQSGGPRVVKIQATGAIDPESGFQDSDASIYSPTGVEQDGYSATLSVVNIQTGQNGFYILQLIQHGKRFTVFRRWGRVGSDHIGGSKSTLYNGLHPALTEFCTVFLEKSGNDWNDLASKAKAAGPPSTKGTFFAKRPGKGVLVETDYASSSSPFDNDDAARNKANYGGSLPKPTQELLKIIFDIKAMQTALKELHIDTDKMPLGKLSRSSIANGYQALSEIETILSSEEPPAGTTAAHRRITKIVSLSNKFFSFVPHVMDGNTSSILNTPEIVKAKTDLLNELMDLCTTYETAMKGATKKDASSSSSSPPVADHPIDESYKKLNSDVVLIPQTTDEFKRIAAYVNTTHGPTHTSYRLELQDLWAVERADEAQRYAPHSTNPNRMLLWHGSRVTNWGGILSQGLRIAPPEAPVTGYMFGKGVYFADVISKSANYCATSREHNTGLMALCEVALGEMSALKRAKYVTKLPGNCQATKGVGRYSPDPSASWVMDNGCKVPSGTVGKAAEGADSDLLYNEYIVYDVSQIRTKYLLQLKFVYN